MSQTSSEGIAQFSQKGYSSFLHGNVVDMLYFPIIKIEKMPDWVPFIGDDSFIFFSPIFNLADASISTGVIAILLFQKRFFRQRHTEETGTTVETSSTVSDETQVL
jgi:signal peptidase II